ncbi:hypothetical protein JCM10212_001484 [Sporobolomyces blumeae]
MTPSATSRSVFRLLSGTTRSARTTLEPVAFFSPSSSTLGRMPFFHPSRLPVTPLKPAYTFFTPTRGPSRTFTSLRSAFSTLPARPAHPASRAGAPTRPFSTTAVARMYRPYSGRGKAYGRRPPPNWKDKVNAVEPVWILGGIIVANVAVFTAWAYGQELAVRFRDATWVRFLQRNFTVSWHNITSGRVWCLLTSAFSHEGVGHIAFNMISLFFMAPPVMAMLGNVGFLSLYIISGLSASTFSLLFNHFVTQNPYYAAHGASGATYGAIAFFAAAMPRATFLLFFVVPVPAWLCVSGIFAWDLFNAMSRRGGMTDSAGHVGGIASGLLFFLRKVGRI